MYKALGIERDDMAGRQEQGRKNYEFFGAPVGIFITVNKALGSNGWGYVGQHTPNRLILKLYLQL